MQSTVFFALFLSLLLLNLTAAADCPSEKCLRRKWKARRECIRFNLKHLTNCKVVRCRKGWACADSGPPPPCPSKCYRKKFLAKVSCKLFNGLHGATCKLNRCPRSGRKPGWTCASPSPTPSVTPSITPSVTPSVSPTPSRSPSPAPTPSRVVYRRIAGLTCPPGQRLASEDFGTDCDLSLMIFNWLVERNLVNPVTSICPNRPAAGGGTGGCRVCGDGVSNLRVPVLETDARAIRACTQTDIIRRWGTALFDEVARDGVEICTLNFEVNDGGTYITQTLAGKMDTILQDALCVDV